MWPRPLRHPAQTQSTDFLIMAVPLGGAALGLRGGGRRTSPRGCRGPALHRAAGPLQGPGCSTGASWQGQSPRLRTALHTMEGLASGPRSTPHPDHWPPNAGRGQAPNTLLPPCRRLSKDALVRPRPPFPSRRWRHRASGIQAGFRRFHGGGRRSFSSLQNGPLRPPPAPVTRAGNHQRSPWDTQRSPCFPHTPTGLTHTRHTSLHLLEAPDGRQPAASRESQARNACVCGTFLSGTWGAFKGRF